MTLTLVPPVEHDRTPRLSVWTKISISLIVAGLVAVGAAVGIGVNWYGNLSLLHTAGQTSPVPTLMTAGSSYVIDEHVTTPLGYRYSVDVRSVAARVSVNTAGATFQVETCATECVAPVDFRPGAINFNGVRVLVRVHATRPGTVVVDGVSVSYKSGIRHASQHVGPAVTITVRA